MQNGLEATEIAGRGGGLLRGSRRVVGYVEGNEGDLECRGEQGALSAKLLILQFFQSICER